VITAKNYAAQMEKGLNEYLRTHDTKGDDVYIRKNYLDYIKNSVHFAMPDMGIIFDDGKKGIRGEKIRLPFPSITIEYYFPLDVEKIEDRVWSSKRVVLARELTTTQMQAEYKQFTCKTAEPDDIWILVFSAGYYPSENFWVTDPTGWVMPSAWDQDEYFIVEDSKGFKNYKFENIPFNDRIDVEVTGYPIWLCPSMMSMVEKEGIEEVYKCIVDTSSELSCVLELCEALSCSNVHHQIMEQINPAVNARRIRDGKTPLYETRTLWIDAPNEVNRSGEWQGGTHRSPRQHLRRGHIRNLQSGKKVWVNAAVVGSKENGIIKKDYAIKELA
jgi:hypothetical protein